MTGSTMLLFRALGTFNIGAKWLPSRLKTAPSLLDSAQRHRDTRPSGHLSKESLDRKHHQKDFHCTPRLQRDLNSCDNTVEVW